MHFTHPKHTVPVALMILIIFAGFGVVVIVKSFRPSGAGADPTPTAQVAQQSTDENTVYLAESASGQQWLILNEEVYDPSQTGERFRTPLSGYDFSNMVMTPLMKLSGKAEILGAVASPADERIAFSLFAETLIEFLNGTKYAAGYSATEDILFEYSDDGIRILMTRYNLEKGQFVIPTAYSPNGKNLAAFLYSCWWCDAWTHGAAVIPTPYGIPEFVYGQIPAKIQILNSVMALEWIDSNNYQYKNFVFLPQQKCPQEGMDGPCLEDSGKVPWIKAEAPQPQTY